MSKSEAIREIGRLSSGTIAGIIKSNKYRDIEARLNRWIEIAESMPYHAFSKCESWQDVLKAIFAYSIAKRMPYSPKCGQS